MYISDLRLVNFRNYQEEKIAFSKNINIFVGKNAQGKTNLLESVYYCSRGNSFKSISDSDIIKHGEKRAVLDAQIIKNKKRKLIHMELGDKKLVTVNEIKVELLKDMKDQFDIVYFWPDHLRILKDGPNYRRDLVDEAISTLKPSYKKLLNTYNKILFQRNNHLKKNVKSIFFKDQLRALNKQMIDLSGKILIFRRDYINILQREVNKFHKNLSDGREEITIEYKNSIDMGLGDKWSENEVKNALVEQFNLMEDTDITKGYTQVGPHRDDVVFFLGDLDTRTFASQGQQRSIILSLKLAEIDIISYFKRSSPILLLDDVFSELDQERKNNFLMSLKGVQSIITTNDLDEKTLLGNNIDFEIRKIEEGKIL